MDAPGFLREHHLKARTNQDGRAALLEVGRHLHGDFTTSPLSGVAGEAMTTDRSFDLRLAIRAMAAAGRYGLKAEEFSTETSALTEALYEETLEKH